VSGEPTADRNAGIAAESDGDPDGVRGGTGGTNPAAEGAPRLPESAAIGDGPAAEVPIDFAARDPGSFDPTTELVLFEQHTGRDGTVTVQVLGWERDGDTVRVRYALPTGDERADVYRWPEPGSYDDSDFLRLVRSLGYPPGGAEHVAGEFVRAQKRRGTWRLVVAPDGGEAGETGGRRSTPRPVGWIAARLPGPVGRRLDRTNPMDVGMAGVMALFLAVTLPAILFAYFEGALVPPAATAVGAVLFLVGTLAILGSLLAAER